ncbi:hypothetical protein G4B88_019502 [Cannabis sativa]|uniref:Uncharacterized protein n=1 Tax=Cannabis sativa TaxID=3483 RepID=A0A7J6HYF6_CANSA|nr:hypothetical protein G4B88_019502 [Cannabis sativa]
MPLKQTKSLEVNTLNKSKVKQRRMARCLSSKAYKPIFRLIHRQSNLNFFNQHHSVKPLFRVERPRHHWNASTHCFQHRVPTAVTHKPAYRVMTQNLHLFYPILHHHSLLLSSIQEPVRINGPMQWIGGVRPSGTQEPSNMALMALGSSDSKVFTMIPPRMQENYHRPCHGGRAKASPCQKTAEAELQEYGGGSSGNFCEGWANKERQLSQKPMRCRI